MPSARALLPAATVALLLGLAVIGAFTLSGGSDGLPAELTPAAAADRLPIDASTSLLVVSPHPDDETLCCAGAIQQALRAGAHVAVVWVTSGDGSRIDALLLKGSLFGDPAKLRALGVQRMREARAATGSLGVAPDRQLFLGYPDGGLSDILASEDAGATYRSAASGAHEVPYTEALFPGHPYSRQSLEQDFAQVLDRVQPTLVLAPSIEDRHPDHRATGLLTLRVLTMRGMLPSLRFWIVHGSTGWPGPRGLHAPLPLAVPAHSPKLTPLQLPLDPNEEARKLAAIQLYHTQMHVMGPYLLAFVRTDEIYFRETPAVPALPHTAPLPATLHSP